MNKPNNGKPKPEKSTKPKKPDWFEANIADQTERQLFKAYLNFQKRIEREFGMLHLADLKKWCLSDINHQNYREKWNQEN